MEGLFVLELIYANSSMHFAVSRIVFSNAIGFQSKTSIVEVTSPV